MLCISLAIIFIVCTVVRHRQHQKKKTNVTYFLYTHTHIGMRNFDWLCPMQLSEKIITEMFLHYKKGNQLDSADSQVLAKY